MPDPTPLLAEMAALADAHPDALRAPVRAFDIGGVPFDADVRPAIMGVVNLSRDSWYRESVSPSPEAAIERGRVIAAQGAGVLNLTGVEREDEMYAAAAEHDAAVIMCFVQGANVREVQDLVLGDDPIPALIDHFGPRLERAQELGVERLFVDPGLGFYYGNLLDGEARVRHQAKVFLNTFRLRVLGWPVCHALPHAFDFFREEVRTAESFFAVLAAMGRTGLFRTHEVPRVRAVLDTMQAIEAGGIGGS